MNYETMIEVLRKAGVEVRDQAISPTALGLPDSARTRLLVDQQNLFRVYYAENLPGTLPMARVKGALKASGDEALLLMDRGGERFVALHTTANGDATQVELGEDTVARLVPNVRAGEGEDAYAVSERVQGLLLHPEEERKAYQNRGLFSDDYLKYRLTDPSQNPEWVDDISQAYEEMRGLYESKKAVLDDLNEAQTESEFLDEALKILGHHYVKQTRTRDGSKPDYALLFGDDGTKDEALRAQGDPTPLYASALTVAEGKYWGRNLDVYARRDDNDNEATASQKSSPEMQISRYLQETGLSWGILTNGSEWRLYHGGVPGKTKRYYSVDLVRVLESDNEEDFRRFYLFFRRDAFVRKGVEGRSFLDRVLAGSEAYAVRVGKELKKVVFERLFARLAAGFLEYHANELKQPVDEEVLKKTYRGTLALLYRLLFLLYAEARNLLPAGDRLGYGARGIARLKRDVAKELDEGQRFSGNSYDAWEHLMDLFRIVDRGDRALNVPPYNGGLFKDDGSHEFLGTHRVSDRYMAPALDELSRQADEGGERRFVDYGFIGVRELGSVYEGLLEFSLRIADEALVVVKEKNKEVYVPKGSQGRKRVLGSVDEGEPYLVNDKKERKATGAYYTPQYIVDYIVENTLGPLVSERREALEEKLAEIAREDLSLKRGRKSEEYRTERRREAGALRTLLDVKVLDPAMGSGHFLVAAVDYLTDAFSRIISELNAEPVVEELAALRAEIQSSLEAYGATATDEQLSDANLLKRMVLKRCVYGVDLNEMAVELAKLSLWLDAFTVGAPLSFLDHHLKHGNSLIGSSVREVRRELAGSGALSGTAFEGLLSGAEYMHELEEIPDATITQVRESASLYAVADEILDPMKRVMDVWTSKHFGNAFAETVLKDELSAKSFSGLQRGDLSLFSDRGHKVFETAADLREVKDFFHWELEFPEVFFEGARERENAGFDAVVGNPPYDVLEKDTGQERTSWLNDFVGYARSEAEFHDALGGKLNIFRFFLIKTLDLFRYGGRYGLIVPLGIATDKGCTGLRRRLLDSNFLDSIDAYPERYSAATRVFEDAKVSPAIVVGGQANVDGFKIRVRYGRSTASDVEEITVTSEDVHLLDPVGLSLPAVEPKLIEVALKLHDEQISKPLSTVARVGAGEIHLTYFKPCFTSSETSLPVVRGAGVGRYEIREEMSQGDKLYLKPGCSENQGLKLPGVTEQRIALQRITGVEDSRRLIGSIVDEGVYLAHTTQYIASRSDFDVHALLALFNSTLWDCRFRITSGTSNVGVYELEVMPVPCINFTTLSSERETAAEEGLSKYNLKDYAAALMWAEEELGWSPVGTQSIVRRNDTVHDLLAKLAQQMTVMHRERVGIEHMWREWVEAAVPNQHKLTKEFRDRGWVEVGLKSGWEGVKAEFQVRNAIPSGRTLQDLKRETEGALEKLGLLYERLRQTDELIDQTVYRLYGLTEDEIAVVEASVGRS